MAYITRRTVSKSIEDRVHVALCELSDRYRICYASNAGISAHSHVGLLSVKIALTQLEECGAIHRYTRNPTKVKTIRFIDTCPGRDEFDVERVGWNKLLRRYSFQPYDGDPLKGWESGDVME